MIVVIADDLTGAAELGGLGLQYDLRVEIVTSADITSTAELLIIATDTRSMTEQQAVEKMMALTLAIPEIKPDLVFKKVDSVLRGHVITELEVHMLLLNLNRAFLVPANPALGRTLTNGKYFIDDEPIHLTSFANDPEFAHTSPDVLKMLRIKDSSIQVHQVKNKLPSAGIIIGECAKPDDLKLWISKADKNTLLAGGSGLFIALLKSLNLNKKEAAAKEKPLNIKYPALFICGSTHQKSKQAIKKAVSSKVPLSYMPANIIALPEPDEILFENWADEIVSLLKKHKRAIIAIDENTTRNIKAKAGSLRDKKAMVVKKIFQKIAIKELFIEGGSTAAAIINHLNLNRFSPVSEHGTGVVKMRSADVDGLFLTLKPGSYDWPADIWNL